LDGVDKRLDGVDKRLDGVDKRLDGVDKRLDGVDKRLDGVDKRLDGTEKLARTGLEETKQLARVVSRMSEDNRVFSDLLASMANLTADQARTMAEMKEQLMRFVHGTVEARTADTERWRDFDERLPPRQPPPAPPKQ